MKFRRSWKSVLAAVLSAVLMLGAVGALAPVKTWADEIVLNNGLGNDTEDVQAGHATGLSALGVTLAGVWGTPGAPVVGAWTFSGPAATFITNAVYSDENRLCNLTVTPPANTANGSYNLVINAGGTTKTVVINVYGGVTPVANPGADRESPDDNGNGEDPVLRTLPPTGPDGHQHSWHWEYGSTYHCSICNTFYTVYPAHDHQYEWYVTQPATETDDGEAHHICKICGDVDMIEPVGAYYLFSQNAENKINKAPIGGTVNVETTRWLSFQGYVLDALAKRPDVTLNVTFRENGYKGGEVKTVTIPAGYDAVSLKDANGYCGFKYLAGVFGAN